MNLKKRLASLLLAVAMLVCLIPQMDTTADAAVSVSGYEIVSYARQFIGYPYKHGAKGPNAFDCSGFVSYVFKNFGIELPNGASAIYNNPTKFGTVVGKGSIANAQMGDIISWSGHAAIYTEDGYCVEALGTKYGVIERIRVNRHRSNGMNYKVIRVKGVVTVGKTKVSSVSATNSGVEIKWSKAANAEKYRVLRKSTDGKWTKLADTTSTSYIDASAKTGKKYSYTVACISKDGKSYTSEYDTTGKSITYIAAPKISTATNTASGVELKWGNVSGAEKYRIFCKTGSGGWKIVGDTNETSYIWNGAKSGTDYFFTVRCISNNGKTYTSGYDTKGKSTSYFSAPKLNTVFADNRGTVIEWSKVTGADKYRIFYKTGDGKWTKIADTASTSYTWQGAKLGTKYAFTVRCVSDDGKKYNGDYDPVGIGFKSVAAPNLSSVANTASGVKILWSKVSGAEKYSVFCKTSSGSWTKIADTAGTSYTWAQAKSGANYTFTVRCVSNDGKVFTSGYDTAGLNITYIAAPELTSVIADNSGTYIKWDQVKGAESYMVMRKTADGNWEQLANTTSTSYHDSSAKLGANYFYYVRCISNDSRSYTGSYNSNDVKAVETPKLISVSKGAKGVDISWGKVSGAEKYRVFGKTATGVWTILGDTTETNYTWTGAKSGTSYAFTVRCISSDGKTYTSMFDEKGKSVKYIAAPKVLSVSNETNGVQINWNQVTGAEKYRVFGKTASGDWTILGDTTSTSFIWKGAKSGTKYSFTVRCISKNGKSYTSSFDPVGKSIKYVAAPKISSLSKSSSGIQIKWSKVTGAEKYRVFCKTGSGDWKIVGDTTSTSYIWNGAKKGKKYTFTVRCISKDGKSYESSFNEKGKSIKR